MKRLPAPPTNSSHYTFRTTLEGITYRFRLQWNRRTAGWYLSIYDAADNALALGVRVVCNWPLLGELADPALPLGPIIAVSLTEDDSDPGLSDLGARVRVLYFDALDRAIAAELYPEDVANAPVIEVAS